MRSIRIMGAVTVALLALFGAAGPAARAQTGAAQSFTLQPGGRASVTFEAFCTNFGQKFPASVQAPNAVAADNIRGALAYIQSNNLAADQNNALEAQYAIWQLSGATGSPAGGDPAKAVVSAAATAPANPQGTSVVEAAKAGQVTVTVNSWQALGTPVQIGSATDNFYGRGTLTIENTSQQALTLYMPVGTLLPPVTAGEQTMAAYATNAQVTNPQAQSAPQQLPQTGGESGGAWLVLAGALALIAMGGAMHMRLRQR